jgi:hypothetical protein
MTKLQKYFIELYGIVRDHQRPNNRYQLDSTITAKIIRLTLAEKFPNVKFSIKTRRYAGGNSVDVDWTDGPTYVAVEEAVKYLEGAKFNSTDDLKSYKRHYITPEGVFFGNVLPAGAFEVEMLADYVMLCHSHSDEAVAAALKQLAADFGHMYTLETWRNGGVYDNADSREIRGYLKA